MGEKWHFPWLILGMQLFKKDFCSERDCMVCINYQRPNNRPGRGCLGPNRSILFRFHITLEAEAYHIVLGDKLLTGRLQRIFGSFFFNRAAIGRGGSRFTSCFFNRAAIDRGGSRFTRCFFFSSCTLADPFFHSAKLCITQCSFAKSC